MFTVITDALEDVGYPKGSEVNQPMQGMVSNAGTLTWQDAIKTGWVKEQ